jgi:hypothetical protein
MDAVAAGKNSPSEAAPLSETNRQIAAPNRAHYPDPDVVAVALVVAVRPGLAWGFSPRPCFRGSTPQKKDVISTEAPDGTIIAR